MKRSVRIATQIGSAFGAVALMAILGLTLLKSLMVLFSSPPCTDETIVWLFVAAMLNFAALVGAIGMLIYSAVSPNWKLVSVALVLPLFTHANLELTRRWNDASQTKCATRTVQEAMRHCKATPGFYQARRSPEGHDELWLVPPGKTDQAFDCLQNWSGHNGSLSIKIDESIYKRSQRGLAK